MKPAPVTIVTRSCGRPELLRRALASVASQSRVPERHVVVPAGDGFLEKFIVAEFAESACPPVVGTLETVWETEKICFLDDDDTWPADFLEGVSGYDARLVVTGWEDIGESVSTGGEIREISREVSVLPVPFGVWSLVGGLQVPSSACVFSSEAIREVAGLDSSYGSDAVWVLAVRVVQGGGVIAAPEIRARKHWRLATGAARWRNASVAENGSGKTRFREAMLERAAGLLGNEDALALLWASLEGRRVAR